MMNASGIAQSGETRRPPQAHRLGKRPGVGALRSLLVLIALLPVTAACVAASQPASPWSSYNAGVEAYSRGDHAAAFQLWQDLSVQKLPRSLHQSVWFQLGNAQFRLGEPLATSSPEEAAELWRRSCEAYRTVLVTKPRESASTHNLEFVTRRLANLTHRLGKEAFDAAQDKPIDPAINLLRTSTENLNEAATLAPEDQQILADRDKASQSLREKLRDRAQQAETKADEAARQTNAWAEREAEDQYHTALDDLGDARQVRAKETAARNTGSPPKPDAVDQSIAQAEDRVNEKLSQLLTRMGQRDQKEGKQLAEYVPDQAFDRYESALARFQEAQQVRPGNEAARQGEHEVRAAMEQLHMREGRTELQRGKADLAQENPHAASALSAALSHYEAATELNPVNAEARAGAEEARRLLPQALTLAGKAEMGAGDRSEPQSPTDALAHYQESETAFRKALDLKQDHQPAKQGLSEVEPKLARLREKVSKEAEAQAKQSQPSNRPPKTLQSLLGQVDEKERLPESERQRQRGQKDTSQRKKYPDW